MKFVVESADEDNEPESFDGAFGLAAAAEPLEHRDAAFFLEIGRLPLGLQDIEHCARDGELVQQSQRCKGCECSGQMKRRRQEAVLHHSSPPLRMEKQDPFKNVLFAGAPVRPSPTSPSV